jgi:hypothetical protein
MEVRKNEQRYEGDEGKKRVSYTELRQKWNDYIVS